MADQPIETTEQAPAETGPLYGAHLAEALAAAQGEYPVVTKGKSTKGGGMSFSYGKSVV